MYKYARAVGLQIAPDHRSGSSRVPLSDVCRELRAAPRPLDRICPVTIEFRCMLAFHGGIAKPA
jgi:hypothetical protein